MGKIILGYPGIGKTTLSEKYENVIDLESSYFPREPFWALFYVNLAIHLASQNNKIILLSTHKEVQEYLSKKVLNIPVYVCYPDLRLKEYWIEKLRNRKPTEKNRRAIDRAVNHFDDDIRTMMFSKFNKIIITDMQYDLSEILR